MPASQTSAADDRWAIEELIHLYASYIDESDFESMSNLFAQGEWFGCRGGSEVLEWMTRNVVLYDGSPRTHHVVSNVRISLGPDPLHAQASSYITVLHQMPEERGICVISANVYFDEFEKEAGQWHFSRRTIERRLVGEAERHRRS